MTARNVTLVFAALVLLGSACSEKKITNNYSSAPSNGSQVYGRITPPEEATEVSLWQETRRYKTQADAQGYFRLSGVEPGLYELRASSPSGAHRVRPGIDVRQETSVSVGELQTSHLPSPLFACRPEGEGVSTGYPYSSEAALILTTELPIDLESLSSGVTFAPPMPGRWVFSGSGVAGLCTYVFDADDPRTVDTEYLVTIGPNVRLENGPAWGQTYVHRFRTQKFRPAIWYWVASGDPDTPLAPAFRGQLVRCRYNYAIDPESVAGAVTLSPSLPVDAEVFDQNTLEISVPDRLGVGVDYVLTIGPPLAAPGGAVTDSTLRFAFRTKGFELVSRQVSDDAYEVPPGVRNFLLLQDRYNLPLDQMSVRAEIGISPPCDFDITSYDGDEYYSIYLQGGLTPATDYLLTIGSSLSAEGGTPIGVEQTIPFRTASLTLNSVTFSAGPWGDGSIDAIDELYVQARFNATVSADSLTRATRFRPEIQGLWLPSEGSDPGTYRFFITESFRLHAGTTYTLELDGSVPLAGDASLGQDVNRSFTVNPVRVASEYPDNGATSVPRTTYVELVFNAHMNQALVESAFRLEPIDGNPVEGTFQWLSDWQMRFLPPEALAALTVYRVTLDARAHDIDGNTLGGTHTLTFRTRS